MRARIRNGAARAPTQIAILAGGLFSSDGNIFYRTRPEQMASNSTTDNVNSERVELLVFSDAGLEADTMATGISDIITKNRWVPT